MNGPGRGPERGPEGGFALVATLAIVVIVALVIGANLRTTELAEATSGSFLQRNRAFNSADGALALAERDVGALVEERVFASSSGSGGVFSRGGPGERWWREADLGEARRAPDGAFTGLSDAPAWVVEEIGDYVADGGSGIVSLDRGAAGYGRSTGTGRELVLYRLQSRGNGSADSVRAVVESLYVQAQ